MSSGIRIAGVTRQFGAHVALDRVDLDVQPGELMALLGPSGSGKTTLLRIIAGLEQPDSGRVLFGAEDALSRHPRERGVGFVFQHYALFRHMTVFENVAFGLRVRPRRQRLSSGEIARRVHELLALVQLDWLSDRYPSQLSGGQRQRVALARALAIEPRVLLLDEPFGALDAKVRKELRRWLRSLHDTVKLTSVFVTHDQEEALELADRVIVMSAGRVEQIGTPAEVYGAPATAFVYEFLGDTNKLECGIDSGRVLLGNGVLLGRVEASAGAAIAYIRPHDIEVAPAADGPAVVRGLTARGPLLQLSVESDGVVLEVALTRHTTNAATAPPRAGDRVVMWIRGGTVFPKAGPPQPLIPIPAMQAALALVQDGRSRP